MTPWSCCGVLSVLIALSSSLAGPTFAAESGPGGEASTYPGWRRVWQDDFQRAELGDEWFVNRGKAELRGGRLFLSGKGATALVNRGFAPDVLLEFVAEANPDLPPCDLSAALGSSNFWGYKYLLAHVSHQASQEVLAVYRLLTGVNVYDDHLLVRGNARQRFLVNGDRAAYSNRLGRLVGSLRVDWARRTSEVLQRDRAVLRRRLRPLDG